MSKKILSLLLSLIFLSSACAFSAHAAADTPDLNIPFFLDTETGKVEHFLRPK